MAMLDKTSIRTTIILLGKKLSFYMYLQESTE